MLIGFALYVQISLFSVVGAELLHSQFHGPILCSRVAGRQYSRSLVTHDGIAHENAENVAAWYACSPFLENYEKKNADKA